MKSIATFLMFSGDQHGKAEEAVRFYTSVFDNGEILGIERYGAGESGPEGTVRTARFELNGTAFMAFDSALAHAFTFTPSMSLFVECASDHEIETAFERLGEGGEILMPLDDYDFSGVNQKFGWVQDRYGVSWQLNLQ